MMILFEVHVDGIARIEKCVGEYNVWELNKTPYAKFKVKVFVDSEGNYTGYTNLQVQTCFATYTRLLSGGRG